MTNVRSLLKSVPGIIAAVRFSKRVQQRFRRLLHHRNVEEVSAGQYTIVDATRNMFVGYYDHSPFKPNDESLLLVHTTSHPAWKKPSPKIPVAIQLLDWKSGRIVKKLGESYSWNWQQGARATWLDADTVAFNIYDKNTNSYKARLVRASGEWVGDLPLSIQESDCNGRIYSISYEALALVRPDYGYRNHIGMKRECPESDIEMYDTRTRTKQLLLSIADLNESAALRYNVTPRHAKLNHVMAAPDGSHLVFLHRYFIGARRVTDLYVLDADGNNKYRLVEDQGVSHVCWLDEATILVTMDGVKGFGYYRVDIARGTSELVKPFSDGHPNPVDSSVFLTDTYPDSYGLRRLILISFREGGVTEVCVSSEPLLFLGETRCDLHPSLSPSMQWIQIDCAVGHQRCIAVVPNPHACSVES
ncbi:hypothetical protein [Kineobactrum salinum]|uniref:Uncharacterized protein n=1 Tax=Kineobactrum salinum TaxID=2708301 RepID=A0A6C0U1Q2_9GAMM|nr:hypothetical protein [Kineobactrum salinum]QIB65971.1 hypothetical protein G3T16_11620 [Kineobactrum salinum]